MPAATAIEILATHGKTAHNHTDEEESVKASNPSEALILLRAELAGNDEALHAVELLSDKLDEVLVDLTLTNLLLARELARNEEVGADA